MEKCRRISGKKRNRGHNVVLNDITERLINNSNDRSGESKYYEDAISGVDELIFFYFVFLFLINI